MRTISRYWIRGLPQEQKNEMHKPPVNKSNVKTMNLPTPTPFPFQSWICYIKTPTNTKRFLRRRNLYPFCENGVWLILNSFKGTETLLRIFL